MPLCAECLCAVSPAVRAGPNYVVSQLDDDWLDFARAGKVSAFNNYERPEMRNAFWTKPEVEIDLAAETGVQARLVLTHFQAVLAVSPAVCGIKMVFGYGCSDIYGIQIWCL